MGFRVSIQPKIMARWDPGSWGCRPIEGVDLSLRRRSTPAWSSARPLGRTGQVFRLTRPMLSLSAKAQHGPTKTAQADVLPAGQRRAPRPTAIIVVSPQTQISDPTWNDSGQTFFHFSHRRKRAPIVESCLTTQFHPRPRCFPVWISPPGVASTQSIGLSGQPVHHANTDSASQSSQLGQAGN